MGQDSGKSKEDTRRVQQDGYNSVHIAKAAKTLGKMKVFNLPDGSHMAPTRSKIAPRWPQDGAQIASRRISRISVLSLSLIHI